jgi:trafficking protein particle complex subunit 9
VQTLKELLPDLINIIMNIYQRAANFSGEALPPMAQAECVIRFSRLLSWLHLSGGVLDEQALHNIISGAVIEPTSLNTARIVPNLTRAEIANTLQRGLPTSQDLSSMNIMDGCRLYAGIISVLSSLDLQRKKALILKDFMAFLTPALIHIRKQGAAEMGIHPAAGLNVASGPISSLNLLNNNHVEDETGILDFLSALGLTYGVPCGYFKSSQVQGDCRRNEGDIASSNNLEGSSSSSGLNQYTLCSFGNLNLKIDVLRTCISFCEALPDFLGVVHFTATLLRTAGPGTAPSANSPEVFVSIAKEEQIRLANTISRTVNAARKLGLQGIEAEYWDDFLVRGVALQEASPHLLLSKYNKADLNIAHHTQGAPSNPFIHDVFQKTGNQISDIVLVAEDRYEFVVTLQNPYEFEVEVQSLRLNAEGCEFTAGQSNLLLGPYRTQRFSVFGTAHSIGELRITGCSIKIKGCRERHFPLYVDPWSPEAPAKVKHIGIKLLRPYVYARSGSGTQDSGESMQPNLPDKPTSTISTYKVIPQQPILELRNISLAQSSIMMLEGEKSRFSVALRNKSLAVPVNFLHISFKDTATTAYQNALSNKDISPAELHEIEYQCSNYPTLRWIRESTDNAADGILIAPNDKAYFEVEILGKPGLLQAIVQFDYCSLTTSTDSDIMYTRRLIAPLNITVNASIQLQRIDVLPFEGDLTWFSRIMQPKLQDSDIQHKVSDLNTKRIHDEFPKPKYFLLLLDFRNAWPTPLSISLIVKDTASAESDGRLCEYAITETIQPGHVSRVVLPVPKLYISDPHKPIQPLNPINQRQFIVSGASFSQETERASREAFWYREELLKRVQGTWHEPENGREGSIDLRGIRLNSRMVESLKLEDIEIQLTIPTELTSIQKFGQSKYIVPIHQNIPLEVDVRNRSQQTLFVQLRLQPNISDMPHGAALDLSKKLTYNGTLQRKLPKIAPGESVKVNLGFCALCPGSFNVGAMVEEIYTLYEEGGGNGPRMKDSSQMKQLDHLKANKIRRTWYAIEPCQMIARR